MVSRGQGKSIEESDNDAAFQRKFNLVQEIYELLPPYTIFILCCASRWMFQSQTLEVFRFFSCEELEAVYYIRGFWQRLMASHYCPNYFSYVSSSGNEVHRLRRQHRTDLVTNSILFSWLYTIKARVSCFEIHLTSWESVSLWSSGSSIQGKFEGQWRAPCQLKKPPQKSLKGPRRGSC